jgi:4-hydroxybenzoate polyprenyltransferase
VLIGVTTAVNSLWEDLADYASDFQSSSRTVPIIFGFRKGLFLTIIMGYSLIPLMVIVGVLFELGWTYYAVMSALTGFLSLRLIQKRGTLMINDKADAKKLHRLGELLAKDFVIIAVVFTLGLMLSSLLKINPLRI